MALENFTGMINEVVGWAHFVLAGVAIYFLYLTIMGTEKKESGGSWGASGDAVDKVKGWFSGLGGKKDDEPKTPEEKIKEEKDTKKEKKAEEKATKTTKKEEEFALREYKELIETKKLLDSNDPKQIYQAAKKKKILNRITRRLNRFWKRSLRSFKKLKDTPQSKEAKKLSENNKIYFQKLMVLLEQNFHVASNNMLDTIDKNGLLKKSKKKPEGNIANFYNAHLNKMKKAIDDAIKWDKAFVANIRKLEKMVEEIEKNTKTKNRGGSA